jgi:hypothetical protein
MLIFYRYSKSGCKETKNKPIIQKNYTFFKISFCSISKALIYSSIYHFFTRLTKVKFFNNYVIWSSNSNKTAPISASESPFEGPALPVVAIA